MPLCDIFADPLCKLAEMIKQREPKLTDSVLIIGSEGQDILIQGARFSCLKSIQLVATNWAFTVGSTNNTDFCSQNAETDSNVTVVGSNTKSAACQITIPNDCLAKILSKKIRLV